MKRKFEFSGPQRYLMTSLQQVLLFLAGVGSGKTFIAGVLTGYFITKFPKAWGFIGANTHQQLTTSTLFRIRTVWKELYNLKEDIDYVIDIKPPKHFDTEEHEFKKYNGIISFKNGCVVFIGSLENAKAHDGKEFSWATLDETKDTKEEDVKETIMTRLRRPGIFITKYDKLTVDEYSPTLEENEPFLPLYIFTSPAKVDWINETFNLSQYQDEILAIINSKDEYFYKEFNDKCVVISSTYHNEENLPKGYIEKILLNNSKKGADKLIGGNPFVSSGGEFYSSFDRRYHVKDVPIRELPLHISFDQNVLPYITATIYQTWEFEGKKYLNQIDEFCLKNPNNKTSKLCEAIARKYGSHLEKYGCFFYGDPSGKKSDTRGLEHDYHIVKRVLRRYLNNGSNRVAKSHPTIIKRGEFANFAFEPHSYFVITINPRCKHSIADFEFTKEDANGKKQKRMVTDPNTKQSYQKYGHTSDSFDYVMCKLFERDFKRFSK